MDIKVKLAQKDHNPLMAPRQPNIVNGCLLNPAIFKEYNSLVPKEEGRVHFPLPYSKTEEFVPCRKGAEHMLYSNDLAFRGLKTFDKYSEGGFSESERKRAELNQSFFYFKGHPEKRPIPEQAQRESDTTVFPRVGWHTKRTLRPNISTEYKLEATINRKQRIDSLDKQRNDIGVSTLGDNIYDRVERQPGFFVAGGLIPGSTIAMKKTTRPRSSVPVSESVTNAPFSKAVSIFSNVGKEVRVIDRGAAYTTYTEKFEELGFKNKQRNASFSGNGVVFGISKHGVSVVMAVRNDKGDEMLIGDYGIEFVPPDVPKKSLESTSKTVSNNKKKNPETPTLTPKQKEIQYELDQLKTLNNGYQRQGQDMPSFEERTKMWLVKPEDEKD